MQLIERSKMRCLASSVRVRWGGIMLLGLFLALGGQDGATLAIAASPDPGLDSPALSVGFQDGLLSIEARDRPWENVLDEVRAKMGIFLRVSMPLEGSVTVSFKNLPVEQGLRRLFGPDANFAVLYPGRKPGLTSAPVPTDIWVLGKGSGGAANTSNPDGAPPVRASVGEDTPDPVQAIEREFASNLQSALDAAVDSRSQELRLKAIAYLGRQAHQEAVDVLLKIAQNAPPRTRIRQGAMEALAAMVQSEPQARAILTQVLETTGTPEMRQWAVETLGVSLEPLHDESEDEETPASDAAQERTQ